MGAPSRHQRRYPEAENSGARGKLSMRIWQIGREAMNYLAEELPLNARLSVTDGDSPNSDRYPVAKRPSSQKP
jgi:hypothetical protein